VRHYANDQLREEGIDPATLTPGAGGGDGEEGVRVRADFLATSYRGWSGSAASSSIR